MPALTGVSESRSSQQSDPERILRVVTREPFSNKYIGSFLVPALFLMLLEAPAVPNLQ